MLVILIFVITKDYSTSEYRIQLYLKTPNGEELKIRECVSKTANFECEQPYTKCYGPGEYYIKAITYYGSTISSESGWQLAYKC